MTSMTCRDLVTCFYKIVCVSWPNCLIRVLLDRFITQTSVTLKKSLLNVRRTDDRACFSSVSFYFEHLKFRSSAKTLTQYLDHVFFKLKLECNIKTSKHFYFRTAVKLWWEQGHVKKWAMTSFVYYGLARYQIVADEKFTRRPEYSFFPGQE